jgi:hypothetical protein
MVISSSDSEELSIRSEGIRGVLLAGYKGCEDFAIYGVYYDAYD